MYKHLILIAGAFGIVAFGALVPAFAQMPNAQATQLSADCPKGTFDPSQPVKTITFYAPNQTCQLTFAASQYGAGNLNIIDGANEMITVTPGTATVSARELKSLTVTSGSKAGATNFTIHYDGKSYRIDGINFARDTKFKVINRYPGADLDVDASATPQKPDCPNRFAKDITTITFYAPNQSCRLSFPGSPWGPGNVNAIGGADEIFAMAPRTINLSSANGHAEFLLTSGVKGGTANFTLHYRGNSYLLNNPYKSEFDTKFMVVNKYSVPGTSNTP